MSIFFVDFVNFFILTLKFKAFIIKAKGGELMKKKTLILDIIRIVLNIVIIVLLAIELKDYRDEEVS